MRLFGVSAGVATSSFLALLAFTGCGSSGSAGSGGTAGGGGAAGSSGTAGSGGAAGNSGGGGGAGGNAGTGGGAGTTGGGGSAGGSVAGDLGIVVTIGTAVTEYRKDPFAYAGRPPILEILALHETEGSFRIVVVPDTGSTIVPGGTYACRTGGTYLSLIKGSTQYDTYTRPGASCTVTVTEVGSGAGGRFAGTFRGTLLGPLSGGFGVENGSFLGVISP
jgi:hypothetical protein